MLYDPRHEHELTLASFALFVASRDPEERYEWIDCTKCAVAQWLRSMGVTRSVDEWKGDIRTANR